jgi:hypothetical protein
MNERVLAGLRAAVAAEAAAGARAFDTRVLRYCEHDAVRAFALRVVSGDDAPRVKAAWWQILPHFDGDDVARAFERADAPDEEVLIWAVVQDAGRWTQRLQDAVFRRMDERPFDTSRVAGILARTRDPRSIDALLERHRVEPDGRIRRGIAIGLGESRDPRARAVFDAACRAARDPSCPTALTEKLEGEDAALVGESWAGMNPEEFAAGNPGRDEGVRRVLDACACAPIYASWEPGGCLAQLARGDWPHARDVARGCTIETVAEVAELRAGLVGFASREELVKHLAQLGLLRPGDRVDARDVSSREILERALRVDEFWARRQSSDAEEAQVLRELAWLVRPELQGFAFEAHVGARDSIEPTVLAAYGAGRKWTVTTARTPQSDVAALVGLVNAILRDRGSDALVAVVKARTSTGPWDFMPPGPDVGAVGGPADGIRQAAADGLITLEDAASVENDGW